MTVHIFRHDQMKDHRPGHTHPEHPNRLSAIESKLVFDDRVFAVECEPALREQLEYVHPPSYVDMMNGFRNIGGQIDADTILSTGSVAAAYLAAGGCIGAVQSVLLSLLECRHRRRGRAAASRLQPSHGDRLGCASRQWHTGCL